MIYATMANMFTGKCKVEKFESYSDLRAWLRDNPNWWCKDAEETVNS